VSGIVTAERPADDGYKWVALANTTAAVFMSQLDGSIVLIAMPAIFTGIHLDPLIPGNIGYLLWLIMGYRLVQSVLVVTAGRLGDMFGRVRIYNAGFAVFTAGSGRRWSTSACSSCARSRPATSPAPCPAPCRTGSAPEASRPPAPPRPVRRSSV
jgi:MFS family permease